MSLEKHKNLTIFKQFGFSYKKDAGNQALGVCPFCGSASSKHGTKPSFYINPETKKWDCKICGENGGYQTFLQLSYKTALDQTTDTTLLKLSIKKSIKVKTLKYFGVVFYPLIGKYLLPTWGEDKEDIYNLRLYTMQSNLLINCAGCKVIQYNLWNLPDDYLTVYQPEGEWDTMATHEIILANNLDKVAIIGIPGAGQFKANWCHYYRDKIVHNLYDNDFDKVKNDKLIIGAGKAGQRKVLKAIGDTVKEIDFINWLSMYKSGFDIRDLYVKRNKNGVKVLKTIIAQLKPEPMPIISPEGYDKEIKDELDNNIKKPFVFSGEGLTPDEVYRRYRKWLHFDDTECLDVLFGSLLANRYQGDPVWMFLVASSGGIKSELIMSLDDSPLVKALSSLTPNTLISGSPGQGGGDPSLIPKLDGKVLAMKDFTVILDMAQQARDSIISQFRDAYDGKCEKAFGTGAERHYKSKFGVLAGVTPNIEMYLEGGSAMGERFLSYYLKEDSSYEANKRIMNKALQSILSGNKDEMRAELRAIAEQALNYDFGSQPILPEELYEPCFALSQWTSIMRGTVPRDKYTKQITRKALIEKPTRLVIQFTKLILGITAFRQKEKVTIEEIQLMNRIASGTVPNHLNHLVSIICKVNAQGSFSEEQLAKIIHLPVQATQKYLEDLVQLKILNTKRYSVTHKDYKLSKIAHELIETANIYERKNSWQSSKSNQSKVYKRRPKVILKLKNKIKI